MEDYKLSRIELETLTDASVDPRPFGRITRAGMNSELTNYELVEKIKQRNKQGRPTYLLRQEYETRLKEE